VEKEGAFPRSSNEEKMTELGFELIQVKYGSVISFTSVEERREVFNDVNILSIILEGTKKNGQVPL